VYFQALLTCSKALFIEEEIVPNSYKSAVDQKTTKRRFVEKIKTVEIFGSFSKHKYMNM
jgi:hypothetical protein